MSTLYWLILLGNIHAIAITVFCASIATCFMTSFEYFDPDGTYSVKKVCKISFILMWISLAIGVLIPPKTELYAIYGVGSVIDYTKNSKEVQKLPDNAVKALNVYLENIQKQDSTDNK